MLGLLLIIIVLVLLFGGGGYYGYRGGYYGGGGFSLIGLLLIIIVLWLLFGSGYAHAATGDDSKISAGPLYTFILPYLLYAFGAIWTAVLGWIGLILHKRFNIQLQDSDRIALQTAAMNAAGRILHSVEGAAANIKIDVTSPAIAQEARRVEGMMEDEVKRLGISPDRVAEMIAGKIGQLQQGTAVSPTAHH